MYPQSVLVTGGASGIGLAIVERFLRDGANVVATDVNEQAGERMLDSLQDVARSNDAAVEFIKADVAEENDVQNTVEVTRRSYGRIDCLVNNAGIGGAFGPIADIDITDWDRTFAVITRGTLLGVKHGARAMKDQGSGGAVVNIASIAGIGGGAGPQAYSCAKAAVVNLGRIAAAELAEHHIRVNTICPGVVMTPLIGARPGHVQEALRGVQPWPELGRPEDVAEAVKFLAGNAARFITGETIGVDGGLTASGVRLPDQVMGGNPGAHGIVGMSHGSSGKDPVIRDRISK